MPCSHSNMQADTYNKNKPPKYWFETKVSATMNQSQLLRQSEEVAYSQAVDGNDGEVILGADVAFDLSGFDQSLGGVCATAGL